jgi:hypothetical protein
VTDTGYSGTPLPQMLGLKDRQRVGVGGLTLAVIAAEWMFKSFGRKLVTRFAFKQALCGSPIPR